MPKEIKGALNAAGRSFALVASRFSRSITTQLVAGATECLVQHGADPERIEVIWVPGSFELPFAAKLAAESGHYDALVGLGCVIRGATPHFDYIAKEVTQGLSKVAWETGIPCILGVITADTMEQAIERAGIKTSGRGWEAALSAVEMVSLKSELRSAARPKKSARG